jgi:hypothetical protein
VQRLGRPELRVEQAFGGVVEHGNERLALVGTEGEPGVRAAIEMQQFAEARARFAPSAMATPGAPPRHEPGFLEGELDETIGERHAVIAARQVMEVAHVEPDELLTIQAQDALDLERRRLAARRAAAVIQPETAIGLKAGSPPAQRARIEAENVSGLQPGQRAAQRPHDHLLHLHGPLHDGRGVDHHHLLGW